MSKEIMKKELDLETNFCGNGLQTIMSLCLGNPNGNIKAVLTEKILPAIKFFGKLQNQFCLTK